MSGLTPAASTNSSQWCFDRWRTDFVNRLEARTNSSSLWTSVVTARVTSPLGGVVFNAIGAVGDTLKLPFQAASTPVKLLVKTARIIHDGQTLRSLDQRLAGVSDLFRSAFKVLASAFAAVFSCTIGFLSPRANVALHRALGLAEKPVAARVDDVRARELQEIAQFADRCELKEKKLEELRANEENVVEQTTSNETVKTSVSLPKEEELVEAPVERTADNVAPVDTAAQESLTLAQTLVSKQQRVKEAVAAAWSFAKTTTSEVANRSWDNAKFTWAALTARA